MRASALSFGEEALGLYGVSLDGQLHPLADYDPILARIERLVPGDGTLADRVDSFMDRFVIPPGRLDAVMRAAIAECRRRTIAHIPLPRGERFALEFVTDQSWSGYNYYQGRYRSLIQVNTDLPVRMGRAIDLGCHEGYPGHHVYNMLLEQRLALARGWIEYTVYPLYSPQSFIAEGSANEGIELAFPGDERLALRDARALSARRPADRRRGDLSGSCRRRSASSAARASPSPAICSRGGSTASARSRSTQRYSLMRRARAEQIDRLHSSNIAPM